MNTKARLAILPIGILLLSAWLASCTSVTATMPDGTSINVVTIAQSRQDIDIGRDESGAVYWKASDSSPDQTLARAILNLTRIITRTSPGG